MAQAPKPAPGAATARTARSNLRQRAEGVASTLPPLMIEAERVAATVAQGVHGRRRVGLGETFWQFRRYEPGDSVNRIDWRRSARSDRTFVRETEWEAAQSVWLWRDFSPSMQYHSNRALDTKVDRATVLLLAAATLLIQGGEHVGLLGYERIPRAGKGALDRMTLALMREAEKAESHRESLPAQVRLPRHAQIVLISDFLTPFAEIESLVRRFAAEGVHGHLLQILDPAEVDLPFEGRTRFEGLENEGTLTVGRAETLREAYALRLAALKAGLADLARAVGWSYTLHRTDLPPQTALLSLYAAFGESNL